MMPSRVVVGSVLSTTLMMLSIYNFTIDNFSSTKAWSYLLLTPWPLVFALSPKTYLKNITEEEFDWEEEINEVNIENKDPIESGYDIPIL
tara:strand:+ start:386 stop:655 length:270 start_codon:yes stop_codon:yes gene_type:complete